MHARRDRSGLYEEDSLLSGAFYGGAFKLCLYAGLRYFGHTGHSV
jgi:hypothetical protein